MRLNFCLWNHARGWRAILLLAVIACSADFANAQSSLDRVRRRTGVDTGEITKVTALAVTIKRSGVEKNIPVEEIKSIYFSGEPSQVNTARQAIARNEPADAMKALEKIDRSAIGREEIVQELDFLTLKAQGQLATRGQGSLNTVSKSAESFLAKHRSSFHVSDVIELLGSAHLASGNTDEALRQYRKLAKAPGAYFQARSAILIGQVLQQQGKHDEAVAEFDRALAASKKEAGIEGERLRATLYKAVSQSALGKTEQATKTVKEIIAQADRSDTEIMAAAYNALGECYLQSEQTQAARDAFLHVDILFASDGQQHAKALYELAKIWTQLGREQRARDAQQRLKKDYPSSRWAKM